MRRNGRREWFLRRRRGAAHVYPLALLFAAAPAILVVAAVRQAMPSVAGGEAVAMNLYVSPTGWDSNPGTNTQPLRTIARAATLVSAGTTVYVAPGSYTDPIISSNSGTADARIRFVSTSRWGAQIRTSAAYRAWLNSGDYIDISGFDISAPDAHLGIQNEGSYARIQDNHVHDVASYIDATTCDSNGGAGIVDSNYSAGYNEVSGNLVHDVGDPTNPLVPTSCWAVHGIYESNHGGKILNNAACHNEAFGIHLAHAASATTISGNLSFDNGVGGLEVGNSSGRGRASLPDYFVTNNVITDNPMFAIRISGRIGSDSRFSDNLIDDAAPPPPECGPDALRAVAPGESGTISN